MVRQESDFYPGEAYTSIFARRPLGVNRSARFAPIAQSLPPRTVDRSRRRIVLPVEEPSLLASHSSKQAVEWGSCSAFAVIACRCLRCSADSRADPSDVLSLLPPYYQRCCSVCSVGAKWLRKAIMAVAPHLSLRRRPFQPFHRRSETTERAPRFSVENRLRIFAELLFNG